MGILYQGVPLYTDTLSLCETIRADETDPSQPTKCPIERKTNDDDANATTVVTMECDAAVPELAPSGEFEARLVGKRTEAATRGEVGRSPKFFDNASQTALYGWQRVRLYNY